MADRKYSKDFGGEIYDETSAYGQHQLSERKKGYKSEAERALEEANNPKKDVMFCVSLHKFIKSLDYDLSYWIKPEKRTIFRNKAKADLALRQQLVSLLEEVCEMQEIRSIKGFGHEEGEDLFTSNYRLQRDYRTDVAQLKQMLLVVTKHENNYVTEKDLNIEVLEVRDSKVEASDEELDEDYEMDEGDTDSSSDGEKEMEVENNELTDLLADVNENA